MKHLGCLPLVLIFIIIIWGCAEEHKTRTLNAKVIHYRVEYLEDVAGSIPTNILPNRMTLIFADKKALNTIDGFLGQFSLSYLADLKKNTVVTMLKIFDKKYFYTGKEGELPAGIKSLEGMLLEETGQRVKYLDREAEKFLLKLPGNFESEVLVTSELGVNNPNGATPYSAMPGVLLQFYTELSVLKMKVAAVNIEEKEVQKDVFSIPENYSEISRPVMEQLIAELFK